MNNMHRDRWSTARGEEEEAPLCERHRSPLSAYCLTDEQVICASCASTKHRGHTIGLVSKERIRIQDKVENLKQRCEKLLQEQDIASTQLEKKAKETDDFCEAILTSVIERLQTHYMSLRRWIQAQEHTALSSLQSEGARLRRRCSQLESLTHTRSDVQFLLDWPRVRHRCEKQLTESTEDQSCPFETLRKDVESLGNRLEEFCKTEFSSITRNECGSRHDVDEMDHDDIQQTNTGSDAEDLTRMEITNRKTRADLLQYACDLTLDPSTAHKDLLLSRDLKEVRVAPAGPRAPHVNSPERFLSRRQLLCKEGLQAERCYYEVEVSGDQAEIALAYTDIDRKSRFKQSAFGANENSWSLDRTPTHYSVSHCEDSVQLFSEPRYKRIGVFLQFKEGAVSFYEVSDSLRFLYTMHDDFNKPLYPGFWIDNNCSIKICDLREQK